jgi:hypothetical protein
LISIERLRAPSSSQEPPKIRTLRPIPQLLRTNIPRAQTNTLPPIPLRVIHDHVGSQQHRTYTPCCAKRRRRCERRDILGLILLPENIATNDTHKIRQRDANTRKRNALVLVRNVVIIPRAEQDGRRRRAPGHHEARKIRHGETVLDVDSRVDDEPDEREREPERDEREPQTHVIGREGQNEQHACPYDVGRDCVEIGFYLVVAQAADDLRKEERHGLQGDAEAHLDHQETVC